MAHDQVRVSRALLSVSDKTGLVDFARALHARGIALVSTGGTHRALQEAGLPVTEVADLTGFPEMMDGRVKTLHPAVHGGLLAIRDNLEHQAALAAHGIRRHRSAGINLYPFEATIAADRSDADCIENIDVGGPAMIRAAAKNHADVAVVTDVSDYAGVLAALEAHDGALGAEMRRSLAQKAFARTAAYDAAIGNWMAGRFGTDAPAQFAPSAAPSARALRYGENPHQAAAFYRAPGKVLRLGGHCPAAPGQGAVLQQLQRHGRRLRVRGRVRSGPDRRRGDHQACQSVRCRGRHQPARSLRAGFEL